MTTRRPPSLFHQFLTSEAVGGVLLMASACVALAVANSPLSLIYFDVFRTKFAGLSLLHWVNDGLMAIFFLLVGLRSSANYWRGNSQLGRAAFCPEPQRLEVC